MFAIPRRLRCGCALGSRLSAPGGMRDHGGVELLREFAPRAGDAGGRVALDLLRQRLVADALDDFAELVLHIVDQRLEFRLQLLRARLLLRAAFQLERHARAGQLFLARLHRLALGGNRAKLRVELVQQLRRCRRPGWLDLLLPKLQSPPAGPAARRYSSPPTRPERQGATRTSATSFPGRTPPPHSTRRPVRRKDLQRGEVRGDAGPRASARENARPPQPPAPSLPPGQWRSRVRPAAPSESAVASRAIRSTFTTCAEKLDRFDSIDCASPMSA